MPDTDIAQIAARLLPEKSAKKEEFIAKYLDPNYYGKKGKELEKFKVACASFGRNLTFVSTTIDNLAVSTRSKEDADMVASLRTRTGAVVKELGKKAITVGGARERVEKADNALKPIATDATRYVNTLASGGRDLGLEGQIEAERLKARQAYLEIDQKFDTEFEKVAAKVREVAPEVVYDPAPRQTFKQAMSGYTREISAVSASEPGMTIEKARDLFGDILRRAEGSKAGALQTLGATTSSPGFAKFIADTAKQAQVEARLKEAAEWLVLLDRWETAARVPIRDEYDRITAAIPETFTGRDGLKPQDVGKFEAAQQKLLEDAVKLVSRAGQVAQAEGELFRNEQAKLEQRLIALENRMATAGKAMSKEQRTPVLDVLASTRLGITGLNGCNLDALKTGEGLLANAETMVRDAENFKTINAGIEQTLKDAQLLCKGIGKTDPKFQAATALTGEITEFGKVWKTKVLSAAQTEATELKTRAQTLATENTGILNERLAIAKMIEEADRHFARLNEAFKAMAAGTSAAGRDYTGTLKSELDVCKSWNATRTELSFYSTIRTKVQVTIVAIDQMIDRIQAASKLSDSEAMLQGLEAKRQYEEQVAKLRDEAEKKGEQPDPAALLKLKEEYESKTGLLTTKSQLVAESNAGVQAKEKDEADKQTFLTDSKALIDQIRKEMKDGTSPSLNDYEDEVKRHIDRLETTQGLIKKKDPNTSGAAALSELGFVRQAFDSIRKRGAKTSKNDLGKIKDQWDQAVGVFIGEVNALVKAVQEFEKTDGSTPVSPMLSKGLSRVISQMKGNALLAPAIDLSREDATEAERRSAREAALAEVRRLKMVVMEDPLVQTCVLNPFGVAMGNAVLYRLEEIELNVLRGV